MIDMGSENNSTNKSKPKHSYFRLIRPQLIVSLLTGLLFFIYFIPEIFITVRSGEAGVHWQRFFGGTVTDKVYGEGLHMVMPWDDMFVYNVRVQEHPINMDALTKEGLKTSLSISMRFHPERELVSVMHKRVGPDYIKVIVIPEVVSVLRTAIGKLSAEELYTTRYDVITEIVVESLEQVSNNYVSINDVIIQSIALPESVAASIEEKIQLKHVADSYKYRIRTAKQEAIRKEIEAKGFSKFNETISASLTPNILRWKGVQATQELATSNNTKVIVIGNEGSELPVILGGQ